MNADGGIGRGEVTALSHGTQRVHSLRGRESDGAMTVGVSVCRQKEEVPLRG